jgi:hypothetical protein
MRIKDLNEGFVDGFKRGLGKSISTPKPVAKEKDNAFSLLAPSEAKKILAAILKGQQLDRQQLAALQKVYNKL